MEVCVINYKGDNTMTDRKSRQELPIGEKKGDVNWKTPVQGFWPGGDAPVLDLSSGYMGVHYVIIW